MGRPRKHPRKWFIATETGVADFNGEPVFFWRDKTRVPEGDRLLKSVPHCFKPLDGEFEEAKSGAS